jgi:hypothetical protein
MRFAFAAALALFAVQPAWAQNPGRTIEIPASAAWQHAESGMVLQSKVAGLARGKILDRTPDERDVSMEYGGKDGLYTTIYVYQTLLPVTGIWMDRAVTSVRLRPGWNAGDASPAIIPFTRPGGTAASGLRTSLDLNVASPKSTAIAIAPLGNWLVKIRMTSTVLDRAALQTRMTQFIEGLRWPASTKAEPAAAVVQPCPTALALKRAKIVREDMADSLMNALMGVAMADVEAEIDSKSLAPAAYCREPGPLDQMSVYRPDGSAERYVIAMGDDGIALSVAPAFDLDALGSDRRGKQRVSMTLLDRNATSALPSFNRLPPPEQALQVARSSAPSMSVTVGKPKKPND